MRYFFNILREVYIKFFLIKLVKENLNKVYLVEGSLAVIWLTILIFISRLFYKSETLYLISNRILLLLLGLIHME